MSSKMGDSNCSPKNISLLYYHPGSNGLTHCSGRGLHVGEYICWTWFPAPRECLSRTVATSVGPSSSGSSGGPPLSKFHYTMTPFLGAYGTRGDYLGMINAICNMYNIMLLCISPLEAESIKTHYALFRQLPRAILHDLF